MRIADVLRELGRPIAYYPYLSRYLGGVNACVLFCQLFYWQDKAFSELGVHKTSEELQHETGLSYEEQRAARTALRACGVLVETSRRIEHKIYFRIDEDALERLIEAGPVAKKRRKAGAAKSKKAAQPHGKSPSPEMGKVHFGKPEKSISGTGKSPSPEMGKPDPANQEKSASRTGQSLVRGEGSSQVVNEWVNTSEITAATRASDAVDNSPAAAAANSKNEKPDPERDLTDLLVELEQKRGKVLAIDRSRDRVHVLTWIGKGVTPERLQLAHASAVGARDRDGDDRPTFFGFVSKFIDQALAPQNASAVGEPGEWYRNPDSVDARGAELEVRARKADEDWRYYRVLVAKASRESRAIEFVLADAQRFNAVDLYQFARTTFGDALMPVDDYAS
ncbi:hypothetical protein [Paraburkholderia sp. GAS82]|uniref:hypothetical protein n=1 Tax=Paraburkholderia sp. GAS82 TaxID=3035137 RepID=UPI003D24EE54